MSDQTAIGTSANVLPRLHNWTSMDLFIIANLAWASQNCTRAYVVTLVLCLNHVPVWYAHVCYSCCWGYFLRASLHAPNTLLAELRWHTLQVGAKMSWSCAAKQRFRAQLAVCDKRLHPKPIWQGMPGLPLRRSCEVCLSLRSSNYPGERRAEFSGAK